MRSRRINLAIPALAAMLLSIFLIAWAQTASTTSPDKESLVQRCGSCHAMEPEVTTWQNSTHQEIACTACHTDPGLKGWVHMQVARVGMFLKVQRGQDSQTVSAHVPNQRCLDCHARQMPWVMQDLEPPDLDERGEPLPMPREQLAFLPAVAGHDAHLTLEQPLLCTDCHNNVSHRAPEGAERRDDFHETCQSCHEQQQVRIPVQTPVLCAACHLDLKQVAPRDHTEPVWRVQHGEQAKTGEAACQACHLMPDTLAAMEGGSRIPVAYPIEKSGPLPTHFDPALFPLNVPPGAPADSCLACHGLPMPHPQSWLRQHTDQFQQQPGLCIRCHGSDEGTGAAGGATGQPAARIDAAALPNSGECAACHGVTMPHTENYLAVHGQEARHAQATCTNCHSAANPVSPGAPHAQPDFCTSCHAGVEMPHAAEYLARHGSEAQEKPESCATCHSAANPVAPSAEHAGARFCTDCHGGLVMPHPEGYLKQHGGAAERQPQVCAACHSPANPAAPAADHARGDYCTTCHAGVTMPHPAAYLKDHGQAAAARPEVCTVCHSPANPVRPEAAHAQPNFCASCHAGEPMPHPETYLDTHAQRAQQAGVSCDRCHSPANPARSGAAHASRQYCLDCHLTTYQHEANWVAAHGQEVAGSGGSAQQPPESCRTCHSPQIQPEANACTACHQGADWHPDKYWFIKHGAAVRADGAESCARCHDQVEPSCSQCHRSR